MDLNKLFSLMEVGVVYLNKDGLITDANPAAESILGSSLADLLNLSLNAKLWQLIRKDGSPFPGKEHPATVSLRSGKSNKNIIMGIKSPGKKEITWTEVNSYPDLKTGQRKPVGVFVTFSDITKRIEIEKQLVDSERLYRTIIERGKDAIFLTNPEGKILQTNEIACKNLGYAKEELLSMYIKDIDADANLSKKFRDILKTLTTDSQIMIKSIHKRKDGSTFPVEVNVGMIELSGKNFILGFVRDITERKYSEEQLDIIQFGIDHSQIAVFQIDEEANIRYVNEQASKSLGYSRDELLKIKIYDLDPNLTAETWKELQIQTRGLDSRTIVTEHIKKDGTLIPVEVTINYFVFENKRFSFSFAKDITDRKNAEKLLKISEAQLSKAMQIAKLAYWEMDWTKNIFKFNDQFYSIYKTSVEKVGGYEIPLEKYVKFFIHPDEVDRVITGNHEAFETDEEYYTHKIEHRMIYGTGEEGYVAVRYYLESDAEGNILKTIGVNQDITQQKLAELDLIAAKEKAEENDKFKTAFLNNMSHEIRTPLNVILGYAGLLNDDDYDPEDLKLLTEPIFRSSEQLQKIIEDILDISRIETGQMTLRHESVCINKLMKQVIEEQKLRAAAKNISLSITGKLRKPNNEVMTDGSKLKQVLVNLVTNSIKYSKKGSIEISVKRRKKDLLFSVKDTGIGIEKKYHSIIFERFQRLNSLKKHNYHSTTEGGTGLGLPISKGLVELLGGKIWLESVPRKGTTFYFTIPRI